MKPFQTQKLVYCALMVALATVLSMVQFSGPWLFGGSITLFSMLPIVLVGYLYGPKWGLLTGAVHGLIQLLLGLNGLRGVDMITLIGSVVLDYLVAFAVLGLAGLVGKIIPKRAIAFPVGACAVSILRFLCHFVSGFLLWYSIASEGFSAVTGSFVYNITYMGPEIIITTLGAALLLPLFPYLEKRAKGPAKN